MKLIKIAPDLEKALLYGVIHGHCAPEIINVEELSKRGKAVYAAVDQLFKKGAKPPFKHRSLVLAAVHLNGVERDSIESYLGSIAEHETGQEVGAILRSARDKAVLINLVNKAGEQLASGDLRVSDLSGILTQDRHSAPLRSVSESLGKRWSHPPKGIEIQCLPAITNITNGLMGIWVIAGEPGLGKSTLVWQIALDVSPEVPVIYYDLDGTGFEYFLDRTRQIYDNNIVRTKKRTKNIFFRSSILTLDEDLSTVRPPAVIVIDSPQTLPIGIRFSKETLDNWLRRFKELSQKGYSFLMTSEKARSQYGEATMGGFKGTGDIEYGATMGAHILGYEDDEESTQVKFIIVKNRHGKKKGHVIDLERDEKKTFWWKETAPMLEEPKQRRQF